MLTEIKHGREIICVMVEYVSGITQFQSFFFNFLFKEFIQFFKIMQIRTEIEMTRDTESHEHLCIGEATKSLIFF